MGPETSPIAEPTGDISGIDADALMSQVEAGGESEIPMTQTPEPTAEPAPAAAQAQAEIEFTWNGKPIKAPMDKAKQWASQGYDYAQKMQEFNQRQSQFQEQFKHYETIDQFAKQNPDWWNHVQSSWESRAQQAQAAAAANPQAALDPTHPIAQELQGLKSELSQIKEFKNSLEQERVQKEREAEDTRLSQEIESIRSTYPDLDLNQVDESGKTLEYKVLEFAAENGIKNFKHAFQAFNHDRLTQLATEKGKELALKERQKQTKLGLLGKSPTPIKGFSEPKNIKNQSYDDLYRDALDELRSGA